MPDMWMDVDTAVVVPMNVLPIIDDTDFKTIETGLVYNTAGLVVNWNFVTAAGVYSCVEIHPTTGGDHDVSEPRADQGMYGIEIPASGGNHASNDTEGFGWITGVATGMLPFRGPVIGFRRAALNDLLIDGGTASTNLEDFFDGTGYAGGTAKLEADLVKIHGTAITETAGQLAGAFTKFFDVATPTGTVNSIPDAVAGAAGGISIVGSLMGADLTYIHGTALTETAGQLAGAFVKFFDVATPVGTVNLVPADLIYVHGSALTETAGQLAASFTKFFNVAAPTGTVNSIPDAVAGAAGGIAIVGCLMGADLTYIHGTALTETAGQLAAGFKKVFDVATPVFTAESVNQTGDAYAQLPANFTDLAITVTTGTVTIERPTGSVVADAGNTPSAFKINTAYSVKNMFITFTNGDLAGETGRVTAHDLGTGFVTMDNSYSESPAGGDDFKLINE